MENQLDRKEDGGNRIDLGNDDVKIENNLNSNTNLDVNINLNSSNDLYN